MLHESRSWACASRAHLENIARVPIMNVKFHQVLPDLATVSLQECQKQSGFFLAALSILSTHSCQPIVPLHAACHLPQAFAALAKSLPISAAAGTPSDIKEQMQMNAKNIKRLPGCTWFLARIPTLNRNWLTCCIWCLWSQRKKRRGELSET